MKSTYLTNALFVSFLFFHVVAKAQSGAVYSFPFRIDPELTNAITVESNKRMWLSGFSISETMPDELIDSIKAKAEVAFSQKYDMPVNMCFHDYQSSIHMSNGGTNGFLEGLPENTFKRGLKDCPSQKLYIQFSVQVYSRSKFSIIGVNTISSIKPAVLMNVKVFDDAKQKVWQHQVRLKDFEKIRSYERFYDGFSVTMTDAISPLDIYAIYSLALEELMK